ncbi:MAG: rod shape-determining protein MreC [Hyphomicrobiales bacterium]|nr:rod shape-determining protein MreC [Hyphomicrobiales bacterium]MCY4048401.1 rod shape-determining protein MreC [Hyphomicrobiales bacterium]MCY4053617.1 rod shape-determining protein MreC [Hyphomicrobiales bacterium]
MWAPVESKWQRAWGGFAHRHEITFLIVLSLVLLVLDRSGAGFFQRGKFWVMDASAPVVALATRSENASDAIWFATQNHFSLLERNEELRAQNSRLLKWRSRARELERQLTHYEDLLNVVAVPDSSYLTARVLGKSGGPFEQAMVLQAGKQDGVEYGLGVINAQGLVGRIIGVGDTTSRVLLLTDFSSRIPILVGSGGVDAIATGNNKDVLRLEYLPEGKTAAPGDLVVTSGDGGFLPAGLPVGEVIDVSDDVPIVKPYMQARQLEWVRILVHAAHNDIPVGGIAGDVAQDDVQQASAQEASQ